jgi:uncharacterized protein (DUF433 family)
MASVQDARSGRAEGWRRRLDLGAYRYAEAARLAQTNPQTIVAWLRLIEADQAKLRPEAAERVKLLSYLQLLELALVVRFRQSGVRLADLADLHRALTRRDVLGEAVDPASRHPFVLRSFKRSGPRECARRGTTLRCALRHVQGDDTWNLLIGEFFEQVDFDERLIVRWYPRGRKQGVVVDPQRGFGTPVIDGSGIPTYIISERRASGEEIEELADDYGLTIQQIAAALAFEQAIAMRAA